MDNREEIGINRLRLTVSGVVQGVGFRPFVYRLADKCSLSGWVRNSSTGVLIEIEGLQALLDKFLVEFRSSLPPLARVDDISVVRIEPQDVAGFQILDSE